VEQLSSKGSKTALSTFYFIMKQGIGIFLREKNEKDEQTAAREIKEETGIEDIEFVDEFRETINYFYKKGEETIYKEVVFFLAQSASDKVTLSKEHIGYAWVSYEHAFKKLTFNNSKELLRKANQFLYKTSNI